jgi:A/G-specific adenine glycosylase
MAQQTQAGRAAEAWERFIVAFPTPMALASAPTADVLRAWRGLGYNRRAIALQRAAQMIVAEHRGRVPSDVEGLRRLPGIGPYSARAVAALAFGRPVGAVDTNVRRVLARSILGVADPRQADVRALQLVADGLAPTRAPGLWTHALMDVGATICRPTTPRCADCPVQPWCRSAAGFMAAAPTPKRVAPRARPRSVSRGSGGRASSFAGTSRWLRGRILDRLRDHPTGRWLPFDEPIGAHELAAITTALRAMARDGLVELRESAAAPEARLPVT